MTQQTMTTPADTGVRALRAALVARDCLTAERADETVALSVRVARRLDLGSDEVCAVEHVALVHDIGKIAIPDRILQKRGPLDPDEWRTMRGHPEIGARIVASVQALGHLAPSVRAEHESWDGSGYPDGLAGDRIPLASRIVLACDALQAMISERPYRRAMPVEGAIRGLRFLAGTQFDPDVVQALLDELEADAAPAPPPAVPQPLALVVDDDPSLRLGLAHGLAHEGFRVHAAASATEAYALVGDTCFDLIVLDWLLPGGDSGATACRRLRYLHPSGEIVVVTPDLDVRDQRAGLEAGARAFLQKGSSVEGLCERLRDFAVARV